MSTIMATISITMMSQRHQSELLWMSRLSLVSARTSRDWVWSILRPICSIMGSW